MTSRLMEVDSPDLSDTCIRDEEIRHGGEERRRAMKRRAIGEILLMMVVFAWLLALPGVTVSFALEADKGEAKACSAEKGDLEGKHPKEQWATSCPAEKKGYHVYVNEDLKASLMARLKEEVQLTDEQMAQVKAVLEAQKEKLKGTMERLKESGASQEEVRKAFQEARAETETKMAEILSAEQLEKYKELKRSYKKWKMERRQGEISEKKSMLGGLKLADEQKAKFDEITERYHEIQKELFKQMMEELKGVLTPEQLKQFKAIRELHEHSWAESAKDAE